MEDEETLGDSDKVTETVDEGEKDDDEVFGEPEIILTGRNLTNLAKKDRIKDLLRWGEDVVGRFAEEHDLLLDLVLFFMERAEEAEPAEIGVVKKKTV